jgi:hypothetical protein
MQVAQRATGTARLVDAKKLAMIQMAMEQSIASMNVPMT